MTPHPEDTRYHIYVRRDGKLVQISSTSKDGIGTAIVQAVEDGELNEGGVLGILDRPLPNRSGTWIVNPFATGA